MSNVHKNIHTFLHKYHKMENGYNTWQWYINIYLQTKKKRRPLVANCVIYIQIKGKWDVMKMIIDQLKGNCNTFL